jgi:hypothetical protein
MKVTLLIVAQAIMAAALPVANNDVLSEIESREASPVAEADPIYYIKRAGYTEKRDAEADPIYYIKRAGYTEKREAEAEADPIFYIKRTGYTEKREAEAEVKS